MTDRHDRIRRRDVAATAGVSVTRASHVLNGVPGRRILSATRAGMLAVAAELGYSPNAVAQGLRTGTHGTIGLIGDGIASVPLLSEIVLGVHEAVKRRGDVLLMISASTHGASDDRAKIASLLHGHVDGVLLLSSTSREVALPDELATHPVVVVNARSEDDGVPWVTPAHEAAGWDAAGALLSAGHARIAFINSAEGGLTPQLRERGFRERAAAGGLRQSDCSVVAAPASAAGAREVALHLLRQPAPPTGIFCFNDRMAMGVYRAAAELGIAVPSGLSIIGSDEDQHIAEGLYPSLTTIALPARAMATWAVDHLYARINNPALPAATAALRCPLVLRESVSAPGRAAADQSS